jgi:hypothetical protein
MQMLRQRLAPGVQHQRCRDLATEPARVGAELDQRCRHRFEQQAVDRPRIALRKRVHRVGQREHQMEVRHRQQLGAPGDEPALLGQGLALRAMPIAAGVVVIAQRRAGIAALDVAAQGLSATRGDGPHGAVLHWDEPVRHLKRRAVAREHLPEF